MYRGKQKDGSPELDIGRMRRWSFMIRFFFQQQHGDFRMSIRCVCTYKKKVKEVERGSWCGYEKKRSTGIFGKILYVVIRN